MKWIKKGLIFAPDNNFDWMVSHASIPIADRIDDHRLRIYFGTRDNQGRSLPAYLDVDADNPQNILHLHPEPIMTLGRLGTFDDDGVMPSWIVNHNDRKYLYYIGWNRQVTVSYRLAIGLAISEDGGNSYHKYSEGPICDRAVDDPYFTTTPCVLVQQNPWRMWYASCTKWEIINGRPEPSYHVKYAESADGIHWVKSGRVCIDYDDFTNAIARPCVYWENGAYKMFYSYRSATAYRTDPERSYRLGHAESVDGLNWIRKDKEVGLEKSASGWDSEMIEYSFVYAHRGQKYLFYNGNGFGKSGFGYAMFTEASLEDSR
jgi:hypothetical protein